jgi:hypothetical protein
MFQNLEDAGPPLKNEIQKKHVRINIQRVCGLWQGNYSRVEQDCVSESYGDPRDVRLVALEQYISLVNVLYCIVLLE